MLPTLCAGFPSPAEDFIEGALELPRWLVPNPPATFIWRVRGWSMKGAGIHDEDLAVVDRSLSPTSGAVVVAVVNGEMSLKRLVAQGNRLSLSFDNRRWANSSWRTSRKACSGACCCSRCAGTT